MKHRWFLTIEVVCRGVCYLTVGRGGKSLSTDIFGGLGWGFHNVWGGINPGGMRFRPPVVGVVDAWKDLLTRDGALLSPGCAGSMCEPQPISDWPAALAFPHRAGRCRPGRTSFSFTACWTCRYTEVFIIRARVPILLGWRWPYALQPVSDRPAGLGIPHRARRCRPAGLRFRFNLLGVGVVVIRTDS